ncbi:helix-turn-helix domain-containing protein [Paenibacillus filicis]|uniref:Helix-turn-helix domain-containing protein n=1 Tax=Paenibacillus gyeongsangnamensis TaxID=3388067 RepID=A0ABT4Q276_9BACL|nr:helix-turn-helix domain-containing protein [Paenibacillus filicis]MCZ8510987.1 helix-turn-helix domain-containing protein [Paenibacillus filicis]
MKRTFFIRLLLRLTIAVVLITMLVGALMYRYTASMLKEEVLGANTELLAQTRKIVEQALGEVQQMAGSLALNSDVEKAVWLTWNLDEDYHFLVNTSNLFSDRINSSNYLHSIYLYSAVNQKLISRSGIDDISTFPYSESLKSFLASRGTSDWEADRLNDGGGSDDVISFYFSVPIQNAQKKGVLMINLKENVLYNAVVNTNQRKLGNVAILNSDGEVLSYKDKKQLPTRFDETDMVRIRKAKEGYFVKDLDGNQTLVSYMTSSLNGWIYVTLNPYNEVFKRSKEVLRLTLLVSFTGLALGVLLMIAVSGMSYRPVRKMVQHIASNIGRPLPGSPHGDEFGYIRDSIDHLHHQNEEFKAKFHEQELILQDHVLVNLLSGKAKENDEMLRQIRYYRLNLEPEHFIVMVLRIHLDGILLPETEEHALNLIRFQIRAIGEEAIGRFGKGAYISQFHRHDVVILNARQEDDHERAIGRAKELAFHMTNAVTGQIPDVQLTIGVGGRFRRLSDISLSYGEAVEALLYERIAGKGSVLSIHDMQVNRGNRNRFIVYRGLVDRLVGDLKTGSLTQALQTKDLMIGELKNDPQFGFSYKHMILTHLLNGLVAVRVEFVKKEDEPDDVENRWFAEFPKLHNLDEIGEWLGRIITQMGDELRDKRENKNIEMIGKLASYIRAHYREPIGLQTLADLVFMNGNYLSKVFKEVTGKTFIDFLTEIRFEEACRLLKETDLSVSEIAEQTGFGQKQNVIRTFKKYTGLTPTEYRNRTVMDRLKGEN